MARRMHVATITTEQQTFITTHLRITPKKLTKNPSIPNPKPLSCWTVVDGYIHLPYTFSDRFEKHMNVKMHTEESIDRDCRYTFTKELRDYQRVLMDTAVSQLEEHHTTRLWTHPGSGKTAMSMYLSSRVSTTKPTLIILPAKIALIKSWEGTVGHLQIQDTLTLEPRLKLTR